MTNEFSFITLETNSAVKDEYKLKHVYYLVSFLSDGMDVFDVENTTQLLSKFYFQWYTWLRVYELIFHFITAATYLNERQKDILYVP